MSQTTWTYEGYWNAVLGANRSASDVVSEFELNTGDRRGLDEWLGQAEGEALAIGGLGELPEEWSDYHERALNALCEAA